MAKEEKETASEKMRKPSKQERLYSGEKGGDTKQGKDNKVQGEAVKEGASDVDGGGTPFERQARDMKDMHDRHVKEVSDMHGRHEKEHKKMASRHEEENAGGPAKTQAEQSSIAP